MEQQPKRACWPDYLVLAARLLLAFTFIKYGWAKLRGGQFGISSANLARPLGQLSLFQVFWYVADQEPFKSFVGVSQILAGLLLLYNRTVLLGALLLLPIAANILVIDIAYVKMPGFYWRLSYYIGLILLIFWHYRQRMLTAYRALTLGLTTRFRYPWWAWLALPLAAVAVEAAGLLPPLAYQLLTAPEPTLRGLARLLAELPGQLRQLF